MPLSKILPSGVSQPTPVNAIINGNMSVAQRGTSTTGLGADGTSYNTVDRFQFTASGTAGRFTQTQDSSAPSGFANSLKFDCTTADTSIAAGEILMLSQLIEGQNVQHFAKGTSDAKPFALSFYVKGNASATYVAELYDGDNNRTVSKTFNVTTDWTRIELSMGADTTGTLDDDNAVSLYFNIWLHGGSNYTGGTLNTSWNAVTQANRAVGISSFFDSTDRTFFITGVQLIAGSHHHDFIHESYAETLAKCQRYYSRSLDDVAYGMLGGSFMRGSSDKIKGIVEYPVEMRAKPSVSCIGTNGGAWVAQQGDTGLSGTIAFDAAWSAGGDKARTWMDFDGATSGTDGYAVHIYRNNRSVGDGSGCLQFDSEL